VWTVDTCIYSRTIPVGIGVLIGYFLHVKVLLVSVKFRCIVLVFGKFGCVSAGCNGSLTQELVVVSNWLFLNSFLFGHIWWKLGFFCHGQQAGMN
jgi:hypothetical protein